MAFGDEEPTLMRTTSLTPDCADESLEITAHSTDLPSDLTKTSVTEPVGPVDVRVEAVGAESHADIEGDLDEAEQSFEDHDAICRRLERSLGLKCPENDEEDWDDWTELASLISYHYAAQMDPAWIKSAGKQNISPSALLLCLIYMERLHVTNPDFRYRHLMTSSDLFVVSLMSACKFLYDVGEAGDCYNGTWARHCKIPIKRLNRMEVNFLNALDWNLQSEADEFDRMMDRVQTDIIRSNLRYHSSMTYSDLLILANLSTGFTLQRVCESIASLVKIFTALTASYLLLGLVTLSIGVPLALGLTRSSPFSSSQESRLPSVNATNSPSPSDSAMVAESPACATPPSSTMILCNESIQLLKHGSSSPVQPARLPFLPPTPSRFHRTVSRDSDLPGRGLPLLGPNFLFDPLRLAAF